MKKFISAVTVFGISIFANFLFAQEISKEAMVNFQSDNIESFKKSFKKDDYNRCFAIKENQYDLLSLSIKHQRKNIFQYMLANTSDINRLCNNLSPLMTAARYGRAEMAATLLKKGATKNLKNSDGETAADFAVKHNHPEMTKILK